MTLPTLQPPNPERWFKYFMMAILVVMALILCNCKGCSNDTVEPMIDKSDSLKIVIQKAAHDRDSLLGLAGHKDSVRVETVIKYRYLKGRIDTIPCTELLPMIVNICDSIIFIDSTQISVLKDVIQKDSIIIGNYRKVVINDSNAIVSLKKEVRKQKNGKKLAIGLGLLGWGLAAVR